MAAISCSTVTSLGDDSPTVWSDLHAAVQDAWCRYRGRIAVIEQACRPVKWITAILLVAISAKVLCRLQAAYPIFVVAEPLSTRHLLRWRIL